MGQGALLDHKDSEFAPAPGVIIFLDFPIGTERPADGSEAQQEAGWDRTFLPSMLFCLLSCEEFGWLIGFARPD